MPSTGGSSSSTQIPELSVSQDSHEFRRQQSWASSSGRRFGGEEYRFGDMTRSALRIFGSEPKERKTSAVEATEVPPHQRSSVSPSKLAELTELDKSFKVAKAEINKHIDLKKINDGDMLQVYALYKQSTVGPCTTEMPAGKRKEKWQAWSKLGTMNREAARNSYCSLADRVVPGWRSKFTEVSFKIAGASGSGSDGVEGLEDGAPVEGPQVEGTQVAGAQGAQVLGVQVEGIQVEGAQSEAIQAEGIQMEPRPLRHASTTGVGDRSVSKDSQGIRRQDSWASSSGRKHGGDAYRVGDLTRSTLRKFGSKDVSSSMASEVATVLPRSSSHAEKVEGGLGLVPSTAKVDSTSSTAKLDPSQSIGKVEFATAVEAVKLLESVTPEDQLLLYSHFKQATEGSVTGKRPGMTDPKGCVKWDAWAALKSMDEVTAQKGYFSLVDRLCPDWRSAVKANAELDAHFAAAGKAVMKVLHISDAYSLAVYAHFKQATCGPLIDRRPEAHDIPACARWAAWAGLSSMSSQAAKVAYCELVDQIVSASELRTMDKVPAPGCEPLLVVAVDLDTLFDTAAEALKKLKSMSTTDQLLVYSHYKQAKTGMVTGNRPGMADPKGRAKWDAWAALKGMDAKAAKAEYCSIADRLVPGWRPSEVTSTFKQTGVSPTFAEKGETLRKMDSNVTSSTPKQVAIVDQTRALDDTAEQMKPIPLAKENRETTATAQVEAVAQSILGKHLLNRCAVLALVLLAFRAAFRRRNASRAAAFSFVAVCFARPELLASVGIKIEVDSNILQATLKDKLTILAPSKPVTVELEKAPEANELVNTTEKNGWTVVGSSQPEMEGWSDVGPSSSESRAK